MTDSLPPLVSVVGYAKSGKTTFICSLLGAAVTLGMRVAVIKTGRAGAHSHRPDITPDSVRFSQAGAAVSVFWSEQGVLVGTEQYPPPLPGRNVFHDRWYDFLPPTVAQELQACDLIIIEGRLARGAQAVHLVGRDGRKYPVQTDDLVVESPKDTAAAITRLVPQGGNDVG
ncbi:MAG: molybdopterin-guanine dinucleotide biosynthesis protein MobB [Spirochaeta sp.]|nr:molybdopterin-guanine dinucleotide biosynthesis protein MobB [Spirochaeta sp.]